MDIDLHRQLTSGSNYRTHSAFYGGRVVAVKVFDGPRAKQVKNSHSIRRFINRNSCSAGSSILHWLKAFCEYHLQSFVSSNDDSKPSHSNVPKTVGISGGNISESPFIVFHGSEFLAFSPTHHTHVDTSI